MYLASVPLYVYLNGGRDILRTAPETNRPDSNAASVNTARSALLDVMVI